MTQPVANVVVKTNLTHATADDYGQVNDHLVRPGSVVGDDFDALTGYSYDYASDGGTPRPYAYVSNESFDQFQSILPGNSGNYEVEFGQFTSLSPQTDYVSQVPAAGSVDLSQPRDTPNFGPGTSRIIRSDGPVAGTPDSAYEGQVATIGREVPGADGPVRGDGAGYAQQLGLITQAALAQQYSQQAALSALVSSV